MKNIGFIGVGYMGYGIAKNILKAGHKLFVVANKNREPIEKIVSEGATEVANFDEFKDKFLSRSSVICMPIDLCFKTEAFRIALDCSLPIPLSSTMQTSILSIFLTLICT